jgi:acetyl-CoA carboxylase biotin carboxyl carrier protein
VTNPFEHVRELAALLAATDIDSLELEGPAGKLRLQRGAENVVSEAFEEPSDPAAVIVRATGVGIFHDRHPLWLESRTPVGVEVDAGAPIGFLRVGPLVTAIRAPSRGIVGHVLVQPGVAVGFGTPLFELHPTGSGKEP